MAIIQHDIDLSKHLIKNGPKFCSHRILLSEDAQTATVKPTLGGMAFGIFYALMGVLLLSIAGIAYFVGGYGYDFALFCGGFAIALLVFGMMLFKPFLIPSQFSKQSGDFTNNNERIVELNNIRSLQINNKLIRRTDGLNYVCYELNMLTQNGRRLNVLNHNDLDILRHDAELLATFLSVECEEYIADVLKNV